MDGKAVTDFIRGLCRDIDAGRPIRYGLRWVILPVAVPTALGLGIGTIGCGASTTPGHLDELCDNGMDDDGDGEVDCDDDDCASDDGCNISDPECTPRREYCEDEFDNNGNGDTDCADLCCQAFCFFRDCPMCEYGVPFEPLDNETDCSDGRDEDCDGQLDCCDPDCADDPSC